VERRKRVRCREGSMVTAFKPRQVTVPAARRQAELTPNNAPPLANSVLQR